MRADFKDYWKKYPKEKFRVLLRSGDDTEEAYNTYLSLLEKYSKAGIRDEQTESNLWCLESAFKAGLIIAGKRKVELELFERIFDSLASKDMSKFDLVKEAKVRLTICHGLQKWGKRLKGGVGVNYEEMKRSYAEYNEICSNINVGDSLETVKKALSGMDKLLKRADKCLSLSELKEIREKLKKSIVVSNKEMGALETRIFLGENLIKTINQMSEQQLARDFDHIRVEYNKCQVNISKFEEVLARHSKEEFFVHNVEKLASEAEEGQAPIDRVRQLRQELQDFTFCRYCEVELFLVNREVECLKEDWQTLLEQCDTKDIARQQLLKNHKVGWDYFEDLEKSLSEIRDKIRLEIQMQIGKKSKRPIICELMKQECDKLQDNLLFLRTIYTKKDGLKSGKTSVFEKSCECFLENYKVKSNKHKTAQAIKKVSNLKEDELRKLFVVEFKRLFESMDILGIPPTDIQYVSKNLEQGIYVKLLDKKKYEKVMNQVLHTLSTIKKQNLREMAKHIRKNEYSPPFIIKISQRPVETLAKIEAKLCLARDNKRRDMFTNKYLAPFEDTTLINKKIKKLKPMEEFDGYSDDELDEDNGTDRRGPGNRTENIDEPYIPVDDIEDKMSINDEGDLGDGVKQARAMSEDNFGSDKKEGGLVYYRVYSGSPVIELGGVHQKVAIELCTTTSPAVICRYTQLPLAPHLAMKVKRRDFENYIDKVVFGESK